MDIDTQSPTRHQRRRQQTRRRLQQAMLALVVEKGYDAVTIQDITDRADLGRGTFYIHFRDKEEVLWSTIQDVIRVTETEAHQQFFAAPPPGAEYYGYLRIFNHVEQHQDLYRVILGNKGSSLLANRVHEYMVANMLNDIDRYGVYADFTLPPEIAAQTVIGALLSLAIWWLETPNQYSPEQMAAMLYEALHHRKPPEKTRPQNFPPK
jgi:AcrR family transcriptional regulator